MRESDILAATRKILAIGLYVRDVQDVSDTRFNCIGDGKFGLTRHTTDAEACQIVFDPQQVTYRDLLEYFYRMHDPTTSNRQGPDTGSQYRSGIFYHSDEQKAVAEEVTKKANEQWWHGKIVTEVLPAAEWWDAEKYHQLYLDNNPGGYECPSHFLRKLPPLK